MELAFIIGVIGTWAFIVMTGLADKICKGGHHEESDFEFLERVRRENMERAGKRHEELMKQKYG